MRELGISAVSCIALLALRMRVSMSAIGSVSIGSPAALGHAGDEALVRQLAQADPAEPELAVDGARTAALLAAGVRAHLEAGRAGLLHHQRRLGHALLLPPLAGEREAELAGARRPARRSRRWS